jgi:hypothetical protein
MRLLNEAELIKVDGGSSDTSRNSIIIDVPDSIMDFFYNSFIKDIFDETARKLPCFDTTEISFP